MFVVIYYRGLRLDYVVCSKDLLYNHNKATHNDSNNTNNNNSIKLYDSFILNEDTDGASDHCPVGFSLEL